MPRGKFGSGSTRVFDGRRYQQWFGPVNKAAARKFAEKFRREGGRARVVPVTAIGATKRGEKAVVGWMVYVD